VIDSITQRVQNKTEALFGANAKLSALAPLAGDASSRRYYRAALTGPSATN